MLIAAIALILAVQDDAAAKCTDAARAMEKAVAEGDEKAFVRYFDLGALADTAVAGEKVSADIRSGFKAGLKSGFDLGKQLARAVEAGGSFTLLRVRTVEGRHRALFRVVNAEGGLNYHDYHFSDKGTFSDVYVYLAGELMSRTLRTAFLQMRADVSDGKDLEDGEALKCYKALADIRKLLLQADAAAALKIWNGLPESFRKERLALVFRTQITQQIGEKEYLAALEALEKAFPDDTAVMLASIDTGLLQKNYDKSIGAIDKVDKLVGGDAYLTYLKSNVLFAARRMDKAKEAAREAIKQDPKMAEPHWTLVTIALDEKDWKETARVLAHIETKLGLELGDLKDVAEYAEFVKTAEYREWMKSRGK